MKVHKNLVKTVYIVNVDIIGNLGFMILLFIHSQNNNTVLPKKEIIILGNAC